jgi:signal transduction histidine kinase
MSGGVVTGGTRTWRYRSLARAGDSGRALGRGLVFCALGAIGLLPLAGIALILLYLVRGAGVLLGQPGGPDPSRVDSGIQFIIIAAVPASRWLARLTRSLVSRWCQVAIAAPYRPEPRDAEPSLIKLLVRRARWLLGDPATWRDLLWLLVAASGGLLLVAVPAGLVFDGCLSVILRLLLPVDDTARHLSHLAVTGLAAVPFGLIAIALGLFAAPRLLHGYGILASELLGPTRGAQLERRVSHLARTRSDTLDAGALELRRIERDLHDGAQARLVAMGMTLEVAGQLVDTEPAAAKALLAEARHSSAKALAELRDLVRGIHPPVLADRGLAAAISALALDSQVRVSVDGELPSRPSPPVESAAYFAVSELIANVVKHAEARQVWVDIRHDNAMLRIGVTDNGIGGADPRDGTGLRGIERRLAAFDGVLAVSSPPGGPTVVNMEIPCELSSPKTSSC